LKRIEARGIRLRDESGNFFVRGVSYGPFRENALGDPFPEKGIVERDFALLAELGANTLRVYHVPPAWLTELAGDHGLRLLVGVPWPQHLRFLDGEASRAGIRRSVRDAAERLAHADNLLGLLIGNEIPPQAVRWYGPNRIDSFLGELADQVRQVDPAALVSYANFPMTEYLDLDCVDFVSFNVYLHREEAFRSYVARLQNLAGPRPLVITEFGVDSVREGDEMQAKIVSTTAYMIGQMGCAGGVVFAYTDEWFTGGHDIQDWSFGLVTRERKPKPAFEAVRECFHTELPLPPEPARSVSVVICAYDAERTLEECLESLRRLRYPDYEVIVVDDGSTDGTRAIAERFPEFKLVSWENRGLSAARNEGVRLASGEIVAYTDSDCAVDPDWLTHLVARLESGDWAGVGGPNLPPPEDDWIPEVVARSPGGPTHVLVTDDEAEHVPGCNMAFWRDRLIEVGLFDEVYRAAGDDVDICWRLQDAGHRIGFAPAALVWHRRRATVGAYLKQQRGYGHAEALLYFKHRHRFNRLGKSRWVGRIYSDLGRGILGSRPLVYGGPFGSALFQTLYHAPSPLLTHLPTSLEWNAAAGGLLVGGGLLAWIEPSAVALPVLGLALLAISAAQAVQTALRVDYRGLPSVRSRLLVAALTYLGPLLRGIERHRRHFDEISGGEPVEPGPVRPRPQIDWRRRSVVVSYWNGTSLEKQPCTDALLEFLRPRGYPVWLDDGWKPWDFMLYHGAWLRGEVKILVENHGGERRQVDVGMRVRRSLPARLVTALLGVLAALGLVEGAGTLFVLSAVAMLGWEAFLLRGAFRFCRGFRDAVARAFASLPVEPMNARRAD
jgi:GT2 family glycosyltransferase